MMKNYFFTIFFLFSVFILKAQIVNIPDANFKNALLNYDPVIDTNNDNEIQESEAVLVEYLFLYDLGINDMTGIEAFTSLTFLNCSSNNISSLNTSTLTSIIDLLITNNNIQSLDLSQNINLEEIISSNNPLSSIDLSNNPTINSVTIDNTNVTELDLSVNINIEFLSINNTLITDLNTNNLVNLKTILARFTNISVFDLSNNPNLETLFFDSTNISVLDVSNNPQLKIVRITDTNVESLDLESNLTLEMLNIEGTLISELDMTMLNNLKILSIQDTPIQNIDLSNNSQLCAIVGAAAENLEYVNLQNENNELLVEGDYCSVETSHVFHATFIRMSFPDCPNLANICVDNISYAEEHFIDVDEGVQFIEDCSLSIINNTLANITISPNPVQNTLNINSKVPIDNVKIYSLQGHLLQKTKNNQIDVSLLSSGLYLASIMIDGKNRTIKFIKN